MGCRSDSVPGKDVIRKTSYRKNVVSAVHEYLEELAKRVRAGEIDISEFIVRKGLNKNPKDYPDAKGQPHLVVALQMLKDQRPVNIGDHIPYVICLPEEDIKKEANDATNATVVKNENIPQQQQSAPKAGSSKGAAERARHPDDVIRVMVV